MKNIFRILAAIVVLGLGLAADVSIVCRLWLHRGGLPMSVELLFLVLAFVIYGLVFDRVPSNKKEIES